MNERLTTLFALTLFVFQYGCSDSLSSVNSPAASAYSPSAGVNATPAEKESSSSPFTFVKTKTESDGLRNTMELYALSGKFDLDTFRQFCKSKKTRVTAKAFTYVVLFDNAHAASFPNSPFTALYGIEENKMKHIIAIFEYNRLNGFCEMRVYDPNMWDGIARIERL